jgi:tetratricopeptide (TPR) repeat protein
MSKPFDRIVLMGCAIAAAIALQSPGSAFAAASDTPAKAVEEPKSKEQEQEERRKYVMQPRTAEVFAEVREHLAADRFAKAEAALKKLRRGKLSPYEEAQAYRLGGYVAYGKQDNAAAIEQLNKALAVNGLPPSDQADVLFQIAQIQGVEKRWKDVIATLEAWFKTVEKPNSVGYYLMALSHFQLQDFDAALVPAQQAIEIAQTPQQAWLQLLLAIHLSRKDYSAATPVLAKLISNYPNLGKGYWLQLSALYDASEDNPRALAVMEIAYRKGLLTDDRDLIRLVQLNLLQGIPHRAAQILEKEIAAKRIKENAESFELLSGSWILAREIAKAEAPLARAAELAPKGDLYIRLAQIHMMQEEWSEAAASLRSALGKGGLADAANAELLLGISYYNEKQLPEARSWFARAQKSNAIRQQAQTWLQHVDRELETKRSQTQVAG